MRQRLPWTRILAEGVVIVGSVLVALAADAWWDGRRDRAEEAARLSAVLIELEDARAVYVNLLEVTSIETRLIAELIQESKVFSGSTARLDSIFFQLGPFDDPSPPTAAVDDAVSGGGLSLIRSSAVRRALARYRAAVEAVRLEAQALRQRFEAEVHFHYEYFNLHQQMATSPSDAFPELPDPGFAPRYEELLKDRRFLNQLVGRAALMGRMRGRTREAVSQIDELALLLDSLGFGR